MSECEQVNNRRAAYAELGNACRAIEQTTRNITAGYLAFAAALIATIARPEMTCGPRVSLLLIGFAVSVAVFLLIERQRAIYGFYMTRAKNEEEYLGITVYREGKGSDAPKWRSLFKSNDITAKELLQVIVLLGLVGIVAAAIAVDGLLGCIPNK